jgi:SAM-dependent methyltransferase
MGRLAFGDDPEAYHSARPDYPEWVFEVLCRRCGLAEGKSVFEIGAGTGKATAPLLALGANPLVAIEPDDRLANFLEQHSTSPGLRVVKQPFEDANLGVATLDLGTSATAFHWLDEAAALPKIARALRPGGWWAPFWNIAGDRDREDPFHEATRALLSAGPASPSSNDPKSRLEFGADVTARLAALRATEAFDLIDYELRYWTRELVRMASCAFIQHTPMWPSDRIGIR